MTATEPIRDWADDFDIFDAHYVRDPYPIWDELRGGCPVAHTERWGGSYLPTTHADVTAVAHDVERFSSIEITVAPIPATYDDDGNRLRSIIATDPPDHTPERRLLTMNLSVRLFLRVVRPFVFCPHGETGCGLP